MSHRHPWDGARIGDLWSVSVRRSGTHRQGSDTRVLDCLFAVERSVCRVLTLLSVFRSVPSCIFQRATARFGPGRVAVR